MKILIFGDDMSSEAVCGALTRRSAECELVDPLDFVPGLNFLSSRKGVLGRTGRRLIGALRKAEGMIDRAIGITDPGFADEAYAEKLASYVSAGNYDMLVGVGPDSVRAVTSLRRFETLSIPCAAVMTDHNGTGYLSDFPLDKYCIPFRDAGLRSKLSDSAVTVTGIPVLQLFGADYSRENARNYLVVPKKKQVFFINSAGIGKGMITDICSRIKERTSDPAIYVAARRDDDFTERLKREFDGDQSVQIVAYTQRINVYLKAADAVFTKPSGAFSTSVALLGVPMIHLPPSSDAETANALFFSGHEMAVTAKNAKDAVARCLRLVNDNALGIRMKTMQKKYSFPDSADRCASFILGN